MSYCDAKGYKVGDKFIMTRDSEFDEGDIVQLVEDDYSDCPLFKRLPDGRQSYEYLNRLKPYVFKEEVDKKPKKKKKPTTRQKIDIVLCYIDGTSYNLKNVQKVWEEKDEGNVYVAYAKEIAEGIKSINTSVIDKKLLAGFVLDEPDGKTTIQEFHVGKKGSLKNHILFYL